jgi:hypothetical protein
MLLLLKRFDIIIEDTRVVFDGTNLIIFYYTRNMIILWDHRRVCGPSLTERSLDGTYLYMFIYVTLFKFVCLCMSESVGIINP